MTSDDPLSERRNYLHTSRAVPQHLPGDDEALDLVGALADGA